MRITLGQLRKVIKEEVHRLVESTDSTIISAWKKKAMLRLAAGEDKQSIADEWNNFVFLGQELANKLLKNKEIANKRASLTQEELFVIVVTTPALAEIWEKTPDVSQQLAQHIVSRRQYDKSGEEVADVLAQTEQSRSTAAARDAQLKSTVDTIMKGAQHDFSDLYIDRGGFRAEAEREAIRDELRKAVTKAIENGNEGLAQQLVANYNEKLFGRRRK